MRRYLHILISLILLASPLWASLRPTLAQTDWQYNERIDFYFAGESGLWVVNLTGGNITFLDLDHSAYPYNLIERLELTLFHQDSWNETFNFFRDGVLYDTDLPEFTTDSAMLSLKISEAVTPDAARRAVGEISTALSDGLYLALTDIRELSYNTFELVSPISPTQHFKKVWGMFPTSLEGFLDSVSPSTLLKKKAAYVSVTSSKKGIYYENSIAVGLLEPSFVSNGQFRLEDSIPQVTEMRSSPYSNSSFINLHLRNAYMAEFPEDVSITHSPVEDLTIIKKELKSNETIPNLAFIYKYSYPILIAVREPSSFLMTPGQTLNVTLRVTNIGENMAEDVKITEVEWWDPSDFELIKGDLTAQFPTIRKDQTKTISYSLNSLYTGKVKTITIPPYEVTHPSKKEGGRPIYTTYSNSQVLWLGGASAPTLIARIIDVSDPSPTVEDDLTYYIQIFNEGTAPAEHVMIEERNIGLLEPGGSETVLMRTRPVDDTDTRKTLHSQVSFSYQGVKHYVESPMFDVYFTPTTSLGPSLNVNRRVSLAQEGEKEMNLTVSINLTNIGKDLVDRITMNNRLPKEASYVEGNVSYNPQKHEVTYTGVDLVEGESLLLEYRVLVESGSSVIFPEATFRCFKGDQFLSYRSEVNSHVDSIKLKRIIEANQTVLGINASFSLQLEISGDLPVYRVMVSQPQPSQASVKNLSKTSYEKLGPQQMLNLPYLYVPSGIGSQVIPKAKASGITAGKVYEVSVPKEPIKIFKGLKAIVDAPSTVEEDESFKLLVTLTSDVAEEISNIRFSYDIPEEVEILSQSEGISDVITDFPPDGTLLLSMELIVQEPMNLSFPAPRIEYEFRGQRLNYGDVFLGEELKFQILITENLLQRYGYALLIALVTGLGTVIYIRRTVSSPPGKERVGGEG